MENEYLDKEQQSTEETSTKKAAKKKKKKKQSLFVQILNGDILSKEFIVANLNFIFFVIF